MRSTTPKLERPTFAASRLIEFCSEKELPGTPVKDWPVYLFKELVDNALDACEEAGWAPEICINVKMLIAADIIEQPAAETLILRDTPSWRDAALAPGDNHHANEHTGAARAVAE
jgi:hypothetical protein